MSLINWGIIGCGDVTELKSGPAFNKVPDSRLVAVMRRNADKAADYAVRHNVPKWYSDAGQLINDPEVNAVYIATPPASHESYTMAAIKAGKPVYVEKPMSMNYKSAKRMYRAAEDNNVKLVVAHYRRQWPLFKKLKLLLDTDTIGTVHLVKLAFEKPALTETELAEEKTAWRINPLISGGGLFHDLAPHQLDILYYFFGDAKNIHGIAANQSGQYIAPDLVAGNILFKNNIAFTGHWHFNAAEPVDSCEIIGTKGSLLFSFFSGNCIDLTVGKKTTQFHFDALQHVQQPMIEQTVNYFSGRAVNPCSGSDGARIMRWIDIFVGEK
jgi:predicted dehydrogenase